MTARDLFNFLVAAGCTAAGAAGLMGNLYAECGLRANNLQNSGERKLNMTDAEYTAAVDNGTYDNFVRDGHGYGLAQWTYWSRKQSFLNFMKSKGLSIGDYKGQCEFLIKELKGYKSVWQVLTTTNDVRAASDIVLLKYERPADQSEKAQVKRYNYAMKYYNEFCNDNVVKEEEIKVEEILSIPACVTELAKLVIAGKFGNGAARKENIYKAVQNEVNRLCKK